MERSRSAQTKNSTMHVRVRVLVVALLTELLSATGLHAAPIMGVIASTPVPPGGASDISHIVDGSGLFDPGTGLPVYTTAALHGRAGADTTFVSGGTEPVTSGIITFDLGGLYALDGMAIWNFNGFNLTGVKDVNILGSTDGTNFTLIAGAPTQFAIGANAAAEPAELFSFSRTASFVRFDVLSTYGVADFGLSEVMFTGSTVVPEPSGSALAASGLVALLALVRWRPLGGVGSGPCKPRGDPCKPRGDPCKPRGDPRKPRGDPRKPRGDPRKPRGDPRKPRGDPRKPRYSSTRSAASL